MSGRTELARIFSTGAGPGGRLHHRSSHSVTVPPSSALVPDLNCLTLEPARPRFPPVTATPRSAARCFYGRPAVGAATPTSGAAGWWRDGARHRDVRTDPAPGAVRRARNTWCGGMPAADTASTAVLRQAAGLRPPARRRITRHRTCVLGSAFVLHEVPCRGHPARLASFRGFNQARSARG